VSSDGDRIDAFIRVLRVHIDALGQSLEEALETAVPCRARVDQCNGSTVTIGGRAIFRELGNAVMGTDLIERSRIKVWPRTHPQLSWMHLRRYPRRTKPYSRTLENHKDCFYLWVAWYNFVRENMAVRLTPCVADMGSPLRLDDA
jgi:hypothetical protein